MTQRSPFLLPCVAFAAAIVLPAGNAIAADAPAGFRIMTDQEVASHETAMRALSGQAREEYRDTQYAKLRERARDAGYTMPEQPPWAVAAAAPVPAAPAAATPAQPADDAAARHAAMREKLEASRTALQQSAAANTARLQAEVKPGSVGGQAEAFAKTGH